MRVMHFVVGFIISSMIFAAIGMANALIHLQSDGAVIWGIILMVESVLLNVALDRMR